MNYRLAGPEDQRSIFESLCDFYNGYDPSIGIQVTLDSRSGGSAADEMFGIRRQGNDLDPIRDEAVDILRMQYKRGNNGYVKTKYVTLAIEAENLPAARARFARIETDTLNRFKVMGAAAHVLDGKERLELLYNMGSKTGLEAIEKTVIDRAVQMIYQPYFADPRPENMPILGDLMNALLSQHIPEADRVAQALDLYVNGSLNFFNHRTTVDISNRLVCFDIKGLGKNLKKPGMLIVQDAVWNTVTINRAIGRSTWYFVDEFHLLLKEEQTAAYSAEIWKRFRKWGGIPTGATQNPKDLLSSPEMENAGKEDMPDEAERKGLGTPATRASIIEKLVSGGFVERKGKNLIPTKAGVNLVTVLPEVLTSPKLTADWEQRLNEVAKGQASSEDFMDGIEAMAAELVRKYSHISEDGQKLFQPEKETVGLCPRCGKPVYEGKKNFACSDRACQFVMWKNDRFFEQRGKVLTAKIAAALLKNGKAKVKGLRSLRTGKTYDGTIVLADTSGKYVNYRIEK